jgi:hypothetical protein
MNFWPKTSSGKWAAGLSIAFIILMLVRILPTPLIAVIGLAGFVAGIIAITKKDWSAFVFISILDGLLIIFWISAEILYPH